MASNNLNANKDTGKNPIYGFYRARVESNLDPLHLGRVRLRIPQFHGIPSNSNSNFISNDDLPWAFPVTGTGTGQDHGSIIVPETGDYVFATFENGDRQSPIYFGGCYGIPNSNKQFGNLGDDESSKSMYGGKGWQSAAGINECPFEVYPVGDSPNGKVIYKSPKGFIIMTDETDGQESLLIADNDNQQIIISNPSDDKISEISIVGQDGQSIHVTSTESGGAEVVVLSPDQATLMRIQNGVATLQSGDVSVTCNNGIAKITAPQVQIDADKSTFSGNVDISGDLMVQSDIAAKGNITAGGNNSNHHSH